MNAALDAALAATRDLLFVASGVALGSWATRRGAKRRRRRDWRWQSLEDFLAGLAADDPTRHALADGWLLFYIGSPRIAALHRRVTGTDAIGALNEWLLRADLRALAGTHAARRRLVERARAVADASVGDTGTAAAPPCGAAPASQDDPHKGGADAA